MNLNTSQKMLVIFHQEKRPLMINDCIGKEGLCFEHLLVYKTSKDCIRTIAEYAGRSVHRTRRYLTAIYIFFFISDQKLNIAEASRLELSNPIFLTTLFYTALWVMNFPLSRHFHYRWNVTSFSLVILMEGIEKVRWFIRPLGTWYGEVWTQRANHPHSHCIPLVGRNFTSKIYIVTVSVLWKKLPIDCFIDPSNLNRFQIDGPPSSILYKICKSSFYLLHT